MSQYKYEQIHEEDDLVCRFSEICVDLNEAGVYREKCEVMTQPFAKEESAKKAKHNSRRKTLIAVLKSRETDDVDCLLSAYEEWLLTAKKTTFLGHPMNRWEMMSDFVAHQV
jgi:hypothetical protein